MNSHEGADVNPSDANHVQVPSPSALSDTSVTSASCFPTDVNFGDANLFGHALEGSSTATSPEITAGGSSSLVSAPLFGLPLLYPSPEQLTLPLLATGLNGIPFITAATINPLAFDALPAPLIASACRTDPFQAHLALDTTGQLQAPQTLSWPVDSNLFSELNASMLASASLTSVATDSSALSASCSNSPTSSPTLFTPVDAQVSSPQLLLSPEALNTGNCLTDSSSTLPALLSPPLDTAAAVSAATQENTKPKPKPGGRQRGKKRPASPPQTVTSSPTSSTPSSLGSLHQGIASKVATPAELSSKDSDNPRPRKKKATSAAAAATNTETATTAKKGKTAKATARSANKKKATVTAETSGLTPVDDKRSNDGMSLPDSLPAANGDVAGEAEEPIKDELYRQRRDRNNLAVRRHRAWLKEFYAQLEEENERLKREVQELKTSLVAKDAEIAVYKGLVHRRLDDE